MVELVRNWLHPLLHRRRRVFIRFRRSSFGMSDWFHDCLLYFRVVLIHWNTHWVVFWLFELFVVLVSMLKLIDIDIWLGCWLLILILPLIWSDLSIKLCSWLQLGGLFYFRFNWFGLLLLWLFLNFSLLLLILLLLFLLNIARLFWFSQFSSISLNVLWVIFSFFFSNSFRYRLFYILIKYFTVLTRLYLLNLIHFDRAKCFLSFPSDSWLIHFGPCLFLLLSRWLKTLNWLFFWNINSWLLFRLGFRNILHILLIKVRLISGTYQFWSFHFLIFIGR